MLDPQFRGARPGSVFRSGQSAHAFESQQSKRNRLHRRRSTQGSIDEYHLCPAETRVKTVYRILFGCLKAQTASPRLTAASSPRTVARSSLFRARIRLFRSRTVGLLSAASRDSTSWETEIAPRFFNPALAKLASLPSSFARTERFPSLVFLWLKHSTACGQQIPSLTSGVERFKRFSAIYNGWIRKWPSSKTS